jgi:hypothetical protein
MKYYTQDTIIDNYIKFLQVNIPIIILSFIVSIIVDYYTLNNYYISAITSIIVTLWTYFIHRLFHTYPDTFGYFHKTHHIENSSILTFMLDNVFNFFTIGGAILLFPLLYIKSVLNIHLLNHYVILIWSLVYTSYHSINYHIFETNNIHVEHHESLHYNYGPEWFDIIFATKQDGSDIENMNSGIFNVIVVSIIILLLKDTKYDILSETYSTSN